MRYKVTNIEWETDEDAREGLPTEIEIESTDGTDWFADWLADQYGARTRFFNVERMDQPDTQEDSVDSAEDDGKRMFTVVVRRVEEYVIPVNVMASSKEEAERLVEEKDFANEYCDYWNEMDPSIETTYKATMSTECRDGEPAEGPLR